MGVSGKIIFVNGASSSGKSTLCTALRAELPEVFWHISIDHLRTEDFLPLTRIRTGEFPWRDMRPRFFEGFHRCLPALAGTGNNLIVEYIIETSEWWQQLQHLLEPFDVFLVGVHCPLSELERREQARGDRRMGSARQDFETTHTFTAYDVEVNSMEPLAANVDKIISAWKCRAKA